MSTTTPERTAQAAESGHSSPFALLQHNHTNTALLRTDASSMDPVLLAVVLAVAALLFVLAYLKVSKPAPQPITPEPTSEPAAVQEVGVKEISFN